LKWKNKFQFSSIKLKNFNSFRLLILPTIQIKCIYCLHTFRKLINFILYMTDEMIIQNILCLNAIKRDKIYGGT
jgi:hypothetical protein